MRKIIEMLDFCIFFVGEASYLKPFKKTHPLAILLSNLYAPIARKRVETLFHKLPLEIKLARRFGFYAKPGLSAAAIPPQNSTDLSPQG